jgi:hypothetical protein
MYGDNLQFSQASKKFIYTFLTNVVLHYCAYAADVSYVQSDH